MEVLKVRKGEILEAETDIEYKNSLGQEAEISKGEKSVIGFDGMIHCLKKRVVIVPDDTMEVSGYSATGLLHRRGTAGEFHQGGRRAFSVAPGAQQGRAQP